MPRRPGAVRPPSGPGAVRTVRRVARNSVAPFAANLVGRAVAIVLAVVMARTLGASGTGLYAVAVNLWLYASIVADFGLGTWLTREVARLAGAEQRTQARQTVADALGLRLILSALALPVLLVAGLIAGLVQGSGPDGVLLATLALLGVGLLPGAVSAAGTALFNAYEEMTFPAAVQLGTAVVTTGAGATLLLLGFDVVALGWVSLLVNLGTAAVFAVACARRFFPLRAHLRPARQLALAREALPLMLNGLLNNVFFRFDVQVLQSKGTAAVGYYANAYKVIDAAGAVPSSFVLALFPLLARRAASDEGAGGAGAGVEPGLPPGDQAAHRHRPGHRRCRSPTWPVIWCSGCGGRTSCPNSAIALAILIWFLPLSFFNGLTQYVLIAIGRQSRITLAFAVAALFNVGANLLLIPRYGYVAAAVVTIASEVVLLVPFLVALRGRIAAWPVLSAALRPVPAAAPSAPCSCSGETSPSPGGCCSRWRRRPSTPSSCWSAASSIRGSAASCRGCCPPGCAAGCPPVEGRDVEVERRRRDRGPGEGGGQAGPGPGEGGAPLGPVEQISERHREGRGVVRGDDGGAVQAAGRARIGGGRDGGQHRNALGPGGLDARPAAGGPFAEREHGHVEAAQPGGDVRRRAVARPVHPAPQAGRRHTLADGVEVGGVRGIGRAEGVADHQQGDVPAAVHQPAHGLHQDVDALGAVDESEVAGEGGVGGQSEPGPPGRPVEAGGRGHVQGVARAGCGGRPVAGRGHPSRRRAAAGPAVRRR